MVAKNGLSPCPRWLPEVRDMLDESSSDEEITDVERTIAVVCDDRVEMLSQMIQENASSGEKIYPEINEECYKIKSMEQQIKIMQHQIRVLQDIVASFIV